MLPTRNLAYPFLMSLIVMSFFPGFALAEAHSDFHPSVSPRGTIPAGFITVDGDPSDWAGIPPLVVDPVGDSGGNPDVIQVSIINDGSLVYFLIEFADSDAASGVNKFDIDADLDENTGCFSGDEYVLFFGSASAWLGDSRDCGTTPGDFPGALNSVVSGPFIEASVPINVFEILSAGDSSFEFACAFDDCGVSHVAISGEVPACGRVLLQQPLIPSGCSVSQSAGSFLAENFSLASASWLDCLELTGYYWPGNEPPVYSSFQVALHEVEGGFPGAILSQEAAVGLERRKTGGDLAGMDEWKIYLEMPEPVRLDAGSYYAEIHGDAVTGDSFCWAIGLLDPEAGTPGSANGTPGNWSPLSEDYTLNLYERTIFQDGFESGDVSWWQ